MTSLTDLLNPTFFMFLGILVLVVALIVVYFESKIREQNHKIASMLSLVSSLAEELNGIKFGLNHLSMRGAQPFFNPNHLAQNEVSEVENKLITVSDDEDNDSYDDNSNDNSDEESYEDSDEENIEESSSIGSAVDLSDDESILGEEIHIDDHSDVKILKLNINSNIGEDVDEMEDLNVEEDFNEELSVAQSLSSKTSEKNKDGSNIIPQTDFKTININLEEQIDSLDYKKLPLPKLRSIVADKGLANDTSKLKKNELLKLLGVE
jgi:hypothetical protein